MKKIISVLVIVVLVGIVYFLLTSKKDKTPQEKAQNVINEKKEQIAAGIKDLISKNLKIKCTYEIEKGTKVTTYFQGKDKIRTVVEDKNKTVETIFLKGKIYSWDKKIKQGIIMSFDPNKFKSKTSKTINNPEEQIEKIEKLKADCRQENFSDDLFQPPNDVKFQDLDKLQKMMK